MRYVDFVYSIRTLKHTLSSETAAGLIQDLPVLPVLSGSLCVCVCV